MCHHFIITQASKSLAEVFGVTTDPQLELQRNYFPLTCPPVIRLEKMGHRNMVPMEWGFLPAWWKPSAQIPNRRTFQRKCFNARSESVHEKPSFRGAFRSRRCLMPVSLFMEKDRYFSLASEKPFALAALWEQWQANDESKERVESCTILTTNANAMVLEAGHHRMPVMLTTDDAVSEWLDPNKTSRQELEHLLQPHDPAGMAWQPVTKTTEKGHTPS